jgi:hypothetical protein
VVDHDRYSAALSSEREFNSILFVLFIPSKDKDDNDLHDQTLWANAAGDLFTRLFGGATEMPPARGKWYNEESGEIITEDVILLHSYARGDDAADDDKIRLIAEFCHRMGRETRQGEVALIIDGIFHRMRSF